MSLGKRVLRPVVNAVMAKATGFQRWAYESGLGVRCTLPGRVISIGNISFGGTGKTPVTMALARYLLEMGQSPAILTRGYGSGLSPNSSVVLRGKDMLAGHGPGVSKAIYADEARLQAVSLEKTPVLVGRQRFEAAAHYLAHHQAPSHWLLDDGLQHMRLQRDVEIILLDAQSLWGKDLGWKAQLRRSSWETLKQADMVLVTRWQSDYQHQAEELLTPLCQRWQPVIFTQGAPKLIRGDQTSSAQSFGLVAAIAHPERLLQPCQAAGISIVSQGFWPDHSQLPPAQLRHIRQQSEALLTTEKDYWRDPSVFKGLEPVYTLGLDVVFSDKLQEWVRQACV